MCNLHWCYTFCTGVLHLNCTALSQSELSNFFMYIVRQINIVIIIADAAKEPEATERSQQI